LTCPTCKGTGGDPDDACCACGGAGEIQCFRCGGTGLEPDTPRTRETVDLPWGRARIVEVVNVAGGDRHGPSLELLEYADGEQALRFAAFYDGQLVAGPLVLDSEAVTHLATAAAASKLIHSFLKRLAAGALADDFEGIRTDRRRATAAAKTGTKRSAKRKNTK